MITIFVEFDMEDIPFNTFLVCNSSENDIRKVPDNLNGKLLCVFGQYKSIRPHQYGYTMEACIRQ